MEKSDEGICKNVILYYNADNQFHKRTVTKCFKRHVRAYQSLPPIDLLSYEQNSEHNCEEKYEEN